MVCYVLWIKVLYLLKKAVLRIRDVYPGSRIRIRIRIKEFKYFNPPICSKLSEI